MNYVEVMGGLGNQLFQYAFAKYVEELTGNKSVLYISFFDDLEDRPDIVKRDYSLPGFNFEYETAKGSLTVGRICREYEEFTINEGDDNVFYSGFWQDKRFCDPLIRWCRENLQLVYHFLINYTLWFIHGILKETTKRYTYYEQTEGITA